MTPFRTEETFHNLSFVILDDVFEYGDAAKVFPPGVHPGCLLGTLAQGRGQLDKPVVERARSCSPGKYECKFDQQDVLTSEPIQS